MKKLLCLFVGLSALFSLFASPCYEEVETAAFTAILCHTSIPSLPLNGVTFYGEEENIIPDKIVFDNSDMSLYLDALNTKPKMNFFQSALYSITQNGSTMQKTKKKLQERAYKTDEVIINGEADITSNSSVNKLEFITTGNLSSIDVDVYADLVITKNEEKYIINGTFNIKGGKDKILTVTSSNVTVNGIPYDVEVKYKLTKAET